MENYPHGRASADIPVASGDHAETLVCAGVVASAPAHDSPKTAAAGDILQAYHVATVTAFAVVS